MSGLEISYDPTLKKFTARGASSFPAEAFEYASELEMLDVSGTLSALPIGMSRFKKLRVAFFSNSNFTEVPLQLSKCRSLQMLGMRSCKITEWSDNALPESIRGITLTDNQLAAVPASVGRLVNLQKLMLSGNKLRELPREMLRCSDLEVLRIAANNFVYEPSWLADLPSLAWYSDAGNLFCRDVVAALDDLPEISWHDLTATVQIGKSANNVIFRASLPDGREVAVKTYGGHLSTDGLVADEIQASVAAGLHPNLISAIATVTDTPEHKPAIVLPLVPTEFSQLGLPPNFKTLTRDVFAKGKRFSMPSILATLSGAAAALAHLHDNGVMHGDLYAHNILANDSGAPYVGDFGAASLYQPETAPWREAIDVCAFGNLMDDLLSHSDDPRSAQFAALFDLQQSCVHPEATRRPTFAELAQLLQQ